MRQKDMVRRIERTMAGLALLLCSCATTPARPQPNKVAITNLSVAFLSDRPGLASHERTMNQRAGSDVLFIKVMLANPEPVVQKVLLRCQRADMGQDIYHDQLILDPTNDIRINVPFMAQNTPTQVRCRVEPQTGGIAAGPWIEVEIPANDHFLRTPT